MSPDAERIARLKTSRRTEGERKFARVQSALAELERAGMAFSNAQLARAAKVSRRFVYDHPELLAEADQVRARSVAAATSTLAAGQALTMASLRADLENAQAQNRRLIDQLHAAETRLAELLGMQAAAEVGWVPPDVRRQLDAAETERARLSARIRELEEELEQVRRLNRELMAQVNRTAVAS
jgi:hypothetical protein